MVAQPVYITSVELAERTRGIRSEAPKEARNREIETPEASRGRGMRS